MSRRSIVSFDSRHGMTIFLPFFALAFAICCCCNISTHFERLACIFVIEMSSFFLVASFESGSLTAPGRSTNVTDE